MFCNKCGTHLQNDVKYCSNCGNSFVQPAKRKRKRKSKAVLFALIPVLLILVTILYIYYNYEKNQVADIGTLYSDNADEVNIISDEQYGELIVNQVIVTAKENVKRELVEQIIEDIDGKIIGEIEYMNMYQISLKTKTLEELMVTIKQLKENDLVHHASVNQILTVKEMEGELWSPINNEAYKEKSNELMYTNMGFPQSWRFIKGSEIKLSPVIIGVLDSSVDKNYSEFEGDINFKLEYLNIKETGPNINGSLEHASQVISVIAANHKDDIGISGITSILGDMCTIINIDILSSTMKNSGKASVFNTQIALLELVVNNVTIINCSFGPKFVSEINKDHAQSYLELFNKIERDFPMVIIIAAAGNEKGMIDGENYFPGGIMTENVITVAALNSASRVASFSNMSNNNAIDIAAYGDDVLVGTVLNGEEYLYKKGTSFSAPYVTGTVALIRSINPNLTAKEIKAIILSTAVSNVKINENSTQTISAKVGGKMIRSDLAVLKAINDMRAKEGSQVLQAEYLLGITDVKVLATSDNDGYKIEASIPLSEKSKVELELISNTNNLLDGKTKQNVSNNMQANWKVEANETEKEEKIIIKRADTEAYAFVLLDESLLENMIIDDTSNYPNMIAFTKKLAMGKEGFISLKGTDDPQTIIESLFVWYDTIGDESNYPNSKDQFGWYIDEKIKYSYKGPDVKFKITYYDNNNINLIEGTYFEEDKQRNIEISFFEDGSLQHIYTNRYDMTEGDVVARYNDDEYFTEYQEISNGVYLIEKYDSESGKLRSIESKEKFANQWLLQGNSSNYYPSGTLSKTMFYKEDLKHGSYEEFTEEGERLILANYFEGVLHGEYIEYLKTDDYGYFLFQEANFVNGLRDGITKYYDVHGNLKRVYGYKEDQLEGLFETYIDGKLKYKGQCAENQAIGTWTEFNDAGNVHGTGSVKLEKMSSGVFSGRQIPGYYINKEPDWIY